MEKESVLTVKDLSVSFHMYDKGLEQYDLKVISNLDPEVCPGEIVAIAGSSGSGKSLLAHAVMGLLPENAMLDGDIIYKGRKLDQKDKEKLRGKGIDDEKYGKKGDTYLIYNIIIPTKLDRNQKKIIKELSETNLDNEEQFKRFNQYNS